MAHFFKKMSEFRRINLRIFSLFSLSLFILHFLPEKETGKRLMMHEERKERKMRRRDEKARKRERDRSW